MVGPSLYVGGNFDGFNYVSAPRFAQLDAASGALIPGLGFAGDGTVNALRLNGTRLYGGASDGQSFVVDTTTRGGVAWSLTATGPIFAIAKSPSGNAMYVGGAFDAIDPTDAPGLAAVDQATGEPVPFFPPIDGDVNALATDGTTTLYVGGSFPAIGRGANANLAAVALVRGSNANSACGGTTGSVPTANRPVEALAMDGSTLYVGGQVSKLGGQSRPYLGAIDTTSGKATAFTAAVNAPVDALAVGGSNLYVGGPFTKAGGQQRTYLASFAIPSGALNAFAPQPNAIVRALSIASSTLYAGGDFDSIAGKHRGGLAAFNIPAGAVTPFHPAPLGSVLTVTRNGASVYAGGGTTSQGVLSELDASTGAASSFNPRPNGQVLAVLPGPNNSLYAGGAFTTLGPLQRAGFAQFAPTP